jgi:iron complex transport system substrate-binding protein
LTDWSFPGRIKMTIEYTSAVGVLPSRGRHEGETGAMPVLSRNCKQLNSTLRGIFFALIAMFLLAACAAMPSAGQPAAGNEVVEVTDGLGRTLQLDRLPQRIVSLSPSVTESLYAIGAQDLLVARDDYSTNPPAAQELPAIAISPGNIPLEAVMGFEPDLVIAGEILNQETILRMEELGMPVYIVANPDTFEDLYSSLEELAKLTGREANALALLNSLRELEGSVRLKLANKESSPKVFYELDATDPQNPWTAGGGTFIDGVIGLAGGENIGRVVAGEWTQISAEEIIAQDPDVIILADAEWGVTPQMVAARPGWQQIAAVQNGRVVPFDSNLLSVPGPRLVQGFQELASILHPEVFE